MMGVPHMPPWDGISVLICGYPARVRERLWLAMYVAHIDESGKGGPIFVVGGLTAKAEPGWKDFSTEWQRILDIPPAIPFFKLSDKQGLSDKEHYAKVDAFIGVINSFVERADVAIYEDDNYRANFAGLIGATFDQPYHAAYIHIIQQCALELPDPSGKIDFIFDDMDDTQYLELVHAYRAFKEICPVEEVKRRLGQDPIRRSDIEVLPLQAADLWAGLVRRARSFDLRAFEKIKKLKIPDRVIEFNATRLRELRTKSIERTPQLDWGKFYEEAKARSKRLKTARRKLRKKPEKEDK